MKFVLVYLLCFIVVLSFADNGEYDLEEYPEGSICATRGAVPDASIYGDLVSHLPCDALDTVLDSFPEGYAEASGGNDSSTLLQALTYVLSQGSPYRWTIIDSDGTVLLDTNAISWDFFANIDIRATLLLHATLGSEAGTTEFLQALFCDDRGWDLRYKPDTLTFEAYFARRIDLDDGLFFVIRASKTYVFPPA
eukprot:TRINITY_DN7945_c0_g1_i1.p1 TRINITY_DN7945_c0_g1~~TRINITY_DN7945_c0_g1_i1.p1  ORF type:complete len:194 (+),score=30.78 TRINITY_DN7945_c0_g1_i1:74-655(+)